MWRWYNIPSRDIARARWQSGDAAACKAAYTGSIPVLASISIANDQFASSTRYAGAGRRRRHGRHRCALHARLEQ